MAVSIVCDKYFLPSLEIISDGKWLGHSPVTFQKLPEGLSHRWGRNSSVTALSISAGRRVPVSVLGSCVIRPGRAGRSAACSYYYALLTSRSFLSVLEPRWLLENGPKNVSSMRFWYTECLVLSFLFQNLLHFYSEYMISRYDSLLLCWHPAIKKTDIHEPINK